MKAKRIEHKMDKKDNRLCYLRSSYKFNRDYSEVNGYKFALNNKDNPDCVYIIPFEEIEKYELMVWNWADAIRMRDRLAKFGREFKIVPLSIINNRHS